MYTNNPGGNFRRILTPILIYLGITLGASLISSFIVTAQVMATSTASDMDTLMMETLNRSMEYSVPTALVASLICVPIFWRMMRKDSSFRKYKGDMSTLKKGTLVYCALSGALGCVAGSIMVTMSQLNMIFEGYEEAAENIFSQPPVLQLLAAGIIAPFMEEMLFRGLIYNRLKDMMRVQTAMIISAVIFGFYHGNLIQVLYGFVMGLLLAFVYEKYQTFAAPLLCHLGANMITIILQLLKVTIPSVAVAVGVAAACLVGLYVVLRLIQSQVHVSLTENEAYVDIHREMPGAGPADPGSLAADSKNPQAGEKRKYSVDDYYPKVNNENDDDEKRGI